MAFLKVLTFRLESAFWIAEVMQEANNSSSSITKTCEAFDDLEEDERDILLKESALVWYGKLHEKTSAVVVTYGADMGVQVFGKFGGDE